MIMNVNGIFYGWIVFLKYKLMIMLGKYGKSV